MISIFNGRRRGLGSNQQDVWIQINVAFREHLHLLKGAKLHVLFAIALHMNKEGWAWPSIASLSEETGYSPDTISQVLADLCQITIEGHRILLKYQPRLKGKEEGEEKEEGAQRKGTFASNRYLLFPTKAEVEKYTGKNQGGKEPSLDLGVSDTAKEAPPYLGFTDTVKSPPPYLGFTDTVKPPPKLEPPFKVEPSIISSSDNKLSEEGATPPRSLLQRFNGLMTLLEGDINNKEKNAAVTRFYVALFGGEAGERPPYARVGKMCRQHGHARVAQVLWDVVSKSPRGDPLSYAQTVLKGNKRSGRGADSRSKDDSRYEYYEADPNDPDIKAWLEERSKHRANNQS